MSGYRVMHWTLCCLVVAFSVAGCTSDTTSGETRGSLNLNLDVAGVDIDEVHYLITGNGMEPVGGVIDTSAPDTTASVEVYGLLQGSYTVVLSAKGYANAWAPTATPAPTPTPAPPDGETTCEGSEGFLVRNGEVTEVTVYMRCKLPEILGGVRVNGEFNVCAVLEQSVVKALQTSLGNDFDLSARGSDAEGDPIEYLWTGTGGSIDDPTAMHTTYTCQEAGDHTVTIAVSDDGFDYCTDSWTTVVTCVGLDGPECVENADCGVDEICVDNDCVPDLECIDNEGCDLGDICFQNMCRPDPDLFCDTGLCVDSPALRAQCVTAFLACLEANIGGEEECVLLSILICNECNENSDCDAGDICVDNECVPAPPECVADGDCAAGEVCDAGECVPGGGCQVDGDCASNEVCDAGECVVGDCTGDGDCDDADDCTSDNCVSNSCVHTAEPVGTVCGTDGQCTSDGGCTEGSCTNTDDSTYVCSPAGEGLKGALTACGLCEILGGLVPALCPLLCDGSQSPPSGPAAVCAANTLLLGGNGGACTDGFSQGCLTCYADVAACGTANCAASCSGSGAIGANGCTCIDCVNTSCDATFSACAGYPTGRPNGTPSGTGGVVGGPPACEGIPTPACDE